MHSHMKMRQRQNRDKGMTNAELWFYENYLIKTPYKWTFQAQWQFRLFDFWNSKLGVAFEIDGPEHNTAYDKKRDQLESFRSSIITLRVKNYDEDSAKKKVESLILIPTWKQRRIDSASSCLKIIRKKEIASIKDEIFKLKYYSTT